MSKTWYESKTVWFNILAVVVLIVTTVWPEFAMHELDPTLATGVVAIVNLLLRFVTRWPISRGESF